MDSSTKQAGEPDLRFIPVEYEIETGEAERVAVDFVSNETASEGGSQAGRTSSLVVPSSNFADDSRRKVIAALTTQRNAIKMLYERIAIVLDYLQRLEKGTVDQDSATLRMISALVTSLPAVDSNEFRKEFMTVRASFLPLYISLMCRRHDQEYNDVLLTTYLATLTKELSSANELLDQQMFLLSTNTNTSSSSQFHSSSSGGGFASAMGGRSSRSRNKAD